MTISLLDFQGPPCGSLQQHFLPLACTPEPVIPRQLRQRHLGQMPCCFEIESVATVIAVVPDKTKEAGKSARHDSSLLFPFPNKVLASIVVCHATPAIATFICIATGPIREF
jgi:hypothetical protein